MTIEEIKNLPNGTQLLFDGDDITVFTKVEDGISCNFMGDIRTMPFNVAEVIIERFSIAK